MKDEKLRKAIKEFEEETGKNNKISRRLLNNPAFDKSIIGLTENDKIVYDFDSMVKEFAKDNNVNWNNAYDNVYAIFETLIDKKGIEIVYLNRKELSCWSKVKDGVSNGK